MLFSANFSRELAGYYRLKPQAFMRMSLAWDTTASAMWNRYLAVVEQRPAGRWQI
jgi:hypothetical protein